MKNGWTEAYETAMNDLMEAKTDLIKWKCTAEDLQTEIVFLRRDRDYWQDMATRGGGNG